MRMRRSRIVILIWNCRCWIESSKLVQQSWSERKLEVGNHIGEWYCERQRRPREKKYLLLGYLLV